MRRLITQRILITDGRTVKLERIFLYINVAEQVIDYKVEYKTASVVVFFNNFFNSFFFCRKYKI